MDTRSQGIFKRAPTREKADAGLKQSLTGPFMGDANDHLYQWESSRDYYPSPGLGRIKATLLAINSADDERNPPELGVLDSEVKRIKNGRVLMIAGNGARRNSARLLDQSLATVSYLAGCPRSGRAS